MPAPLETKRLGPWLILAGLATLIMWTSQYYTLEISTTPSVPYRIFLLKKGVLPKKYEWATFVAKNNGVYAPDTHFTKQVIGTAGDTIRQENRQVFINSAWCCYAKTQSKTGEPLTLGKSGTLSRGQYFMHGPHQDSFDSRYKNIGWIHESQILGTAVPLL